MTTITIADAARRSRPVYRSSEQFRLLGVLFHAAQPLYIRIANVTERVALFRLVKAGLVEASEKQVHNCCTHMHTEYSITLGGRALFAASELGLSFIQLCYLACARHAARNSVIGGRPSFVAAAVDPTFSTVFAGISPEVTRKELTKKRFLITRTWHTYEVTGRFAELERYAAVMDKVYAWMRADYNEKLNQAMRDPVIAKMVDLVSRHSG